MKFGNYFRLIAIAVGTLTLAAFSYAQTATDGKIANMSVGGGSVRWDITVPNGGGSITIAFPDGRSVTKELHGSSVQFDITDKQLDGVPDGVYNYDLRLTPLLTPGQKDAIMKARGKDDDPESDRAGRKRPTVTPLVQSGTFAVLNGVLVGPGAIEAQRGATNRGGQAPTQPAAAPAVSGNAVSRMLNHRAPLTPFFQLFASDVEIQGSLCVGLDCTSTESFGFDTIRLKENNTRIKFDDTSTSSGFPNNDWQLTANDSNSGGANKFSIDDVTGSKTPFTITAGAPTNSLFVASSGKVALGNSSPGLNLHITATDTPAIRQEQTSGGGFTAQTWDIGANEANWFVRDLTGGSRLPLRIRPGAPTSSVDISASGNVGIGTASPASKLHVFASSAGIFVGAGAPSTYLLGSVGTGGTATDLLQVGISGATNGFTMRSDASNNLTYSWLTGSGAQGLFQKSDGTIGIGTSAPTQTLSVNGTAGKPGGGTWDVFSDERLKNIKGPYQRGLKSLMQLQPVRYEYKRDNPLGLKLQGENVGFGAQSLQKLIPEAVTQDSTGYLMVKSDPILWTMLNAIKEQQKEIESLKNQVAKLTATSHHRRRNR